MQLVPQFLRHRRFLVMPLAFFCAINVAWGAASDEQSSSQEKASTGAFARQSWRKQDVEYIEKLEKEAQTGSPEAQYKLAQAYNNWPANDPVASAVWFRKAADQGYAPAEYVMGTRYVSGRGVEKDKAQALAWYQRAASHHSCEAQVELALNIDALPLPEGENIPPIERLRKVAESGCPLAQYAMGGRLEPQAPSWDKTADRRESCKWYLKAAENGFMQAMAAVSLCYKQDLGLGKDEAKADYWWRKFSEFGAVTPIKQ